MPKENEIWNTVDRHPGNALTFLRCRAHLGDLGAIFLDRLVAGHAKIGRWDFSFVALGDTGVAALAEHAHLTGMNLVTESDWLWLDGFGKNFLMFLWGSSLLSPGRARGADSHKDGQKTGPTGSTPRSG
jgi:hypothetical protein